MNTLEDKNMEMLEISRKKNIFNIYKKKEEMLEIKVTLNNDVGMKIECNPEEKFKNYFNFSSFIIAPEFMNICYKKKFFMTIGLKKLDGKKYLLFYFEKGKEIYLKEKTL